MSRLEVRVENVLDAPERELAMPVRHGLDEALIGNEIVAEDRGDGEQRLDAVVGLAVRLAAGLELLCERIADVDRIAAVGEARDVAHPAGDRECEVRDRSARLQAFARRSEQALRQLLR